MSNQYYPTYDETLDWANQDDLIFDSECSICLEQPRYEDEDGTQFCEEHMAKKLLEDPAWVAMKVEEVNERRKELGIPPLGSKVSDKKHQTMSTTTLHPGV